MEWNWIVAAAVAALPRRGRGVVLPGRRVVVLLVVTLLVVAFFWFLWMPLWLDGSEAATPPVAPTGG